jgi:hypothetical protein
MTTPTAILISALIFATASLFLFRSEMQTANNEVEKTHDVGAVYLLDGWTGSVSRCATIVTSPEGYNASQNIASFLTGACGW